MEWSRSRHPHISCWTTANSGSITAANLPNLTYAPATNENGAKTFTVTASDGSTSSAAATVTMSLTAVNDAPVFTSSTAVSVAENQTTVQTVAATDAESQAITYSLNGGADAAKFSLTSGGVLTFASAPDYEAPLHIQPVNLDASKTPLRRTLAFQRQRRPPHKVFLAQIHGPDKAASSRAMH